MRVSFPTCVRESIKQEEDPIATYTYQCNCGLRFDKYAPMANHSKPQACPECKSMASRHMPDGVNGVFHLTTSGVGPQNTGVTDLDSNLDRVVGEDAKKGWAAIEVRDRGKAQTLRDNPGSTSYDLSKNPDGSYRVMSLAEKRIHARAFTINAMAHQSGTAKPSNP